MTDKWGPTWWRFLHSVSATYPCAPSAAERRAARRLVESVAALLPCPRCKTHFQALLKRTPADVSGRRALATWMWAAHNDVNRRLGKPEVELEEVLETLAPCAEAQSAAAPGSADGAGRRWCLAATTVVAAVALAFAWRKSRARGSSP